MTKYIIVLPDGTEIGSGAGTQNAIASVSITTSVNSEVDLTLGSVCSSLLDATLITPNAGISVTAGEEITLYQEDENGERTKTGVFIVDKPTRPSANRMKLTAYDNVSKLDKDLTQWMRTLMGWPYTLSEFADLICEACGVTRKAQTVPNENFTISINPTTETITGRQLMKWLAEIAGSFVTANEDGEIVFGWYEDTGISIETTGENYYFADSLSYEDYAVTPADAVKIRLSESEDGEVLWPSGDAENPYIVKGNKILILNILSQTTDVLAEMQQAAALSYTPCKVTVPASVGVKAGQIIRITDRNGITFSTCVMQVKQSGQRLTLESTGNKMRSSSDSLNNTTVSDLKDYVDVTVTNETQQVFESYKVEVEKDIDSLSASVTETQTQITTTTENIYNEIDGVRQESVTHEQLEEVKSTVLELSSDNVEIRFAQVKNLIDELGGTVEESQRLLEEYIRFEGARMTLGRSDSTITAVLQNDRLSFLENGQEVAYISNLTLFVTDIHVQRRLRHGNADVGYYDWEIGETGTLDLVYTEE